VGLALLAFLTVCLSIMVGHHLVSMLLTRDSARVRKRIADEFGQAPGKPASTSPLYKNLDQLSLEGGVFADSEAVRPPAAPKGILGRLDAWLDSAGLSWTAPQLFALMALCSLSTALAAGWFGGLAAAVIVGAIAAFVPLVYVHVTYTARQAKYLKQLPNAFELMARVIRAGQSVPQALQAVADAFEEPLASDFKSCVQKQHLGMRPETAFQAMGEASGILEMRIFAMAMGIQRQSGGNLSEVLERLAGLVRARLKLRQQVRTLTAEGRMQGGTLVVLPFLVFGVLMFVNRSYIEVLFQHPMLIAATLISMTVGMLWIRKIVNIDH
jgi:tight adherence protein B